MTSRDILIRKIHQKDNHTFTIEWSDGCLADYRLSDLQRNCPCANCVDETSGKRVVDPATIRDDVRAVQMTNVGRYALRIQFTQGCSTGIYEFALLRKMAGLES